MIRVSVLARQATRWLAMGGAVLAFAGSAAAQQEPLGIVVMHGKGGAPTRWVSDLAQALESKGYLVANLEMPWSGRRDYDVPVSRAEEEVAAAIAGLREKGAKRIFISGHSQGGLFALHLAGKMRVDGVIPIAPGGSVGSKLFREKLGDSVARARRLVAEGKGGEPERFEDYEGSRGANPVVVTPAVYLTWFDPEGAMNIERAARALPPEVPVLFVLPTRDYPGLRRLSPRIYALLPRNARTRLYEPDSDHLGAPSASVDEILRWTSEIATAK